MKRAMRNSNDSSESGSTANTKIVASKDVGRAQNCTKDLHHNNRTLHESSKNRHNSESCVWSPNLTPKKEGVDHKVVDSLVYSCQLLLCDY